MFSNQDIDYSLNRPCRNLSAVAAAKSSTLKTKSTSIADDNDDVGDSNGDGWDDDVDNDDYLETSSPSFTSHRFLVSSAIPSVSKLSNDNTTADDEEDDGVNNNTNNNNLIEEDDEERTNKLYLLQYHEDSHELTQESSWVHPTGEVWSMTCHPTRGEWVVTCGGGAVFSENMGMMGNNDDEDETTNDNNNNIPLTKFHTTLWRIPDLYGSGNGDNEDDDDEFNFDANNNDGETRQRTDSGTTSSALKLEPVVTIPHGLNNTQTSSTGWEQRVGQILWNPLLSPSNTSGDALYDLADTSSTDGGGNLLTVGWDAQLSPISLWDISSLSDVKEVWSTHGGSGVASTRRRGRFGKFATMSTALPRRCSWDPHDTHHILATSGVDVLAYDMRVPASSSGLGVIRSAHRYGVADVCHNHLQSNVVVTAGMDGVMKFWDLRVHLSNRSDAFEPLAVSGKNESSGPTLPPPLLKAVRGGHSHWTTRATYNPSYDQLVLSGGSDGIANLWRISSCSSAPLLDLGDEEEENDDIGESSYGEDEDIVEEKDEYAAGEQDDWTEDQQSPKSDEGDNKDGNKPRNIESNAHDVRVTRFECSDVTADVAWSASDPWVYATLSYDGAIVVHHVPSKEKYKILL